MATVDQPPPCSLLYYRIIDLTVECNDKQQLASLASHSGEKEGSSAGGRGLSLWQAS